MPLSVDWDPERPDELRGAARRRYEAARATFLLLVQGEMGRRLVVIETFNLAQSLVEDLQLMVAMPEGRA